MIRKEDITILSPHRLENSCLNEMSDKEFEIINLSQDYTALKNDFFNFSTKFGNYLKFYLVEFWGRLI
ncbi:MAG: hypothetical protein KJ770_07165 [Actinobacteria bacterium]|nr:hypothetical protein [Actinomycetota bacterium]